MTTVKAKKASIGGLQLLNTLGAHYPGLKVVVEGETSSFRCERLLKPSNLL